MGQVCFIYRQSEEYLELIMLFYDLSFINYYYFQDYVCDLLCTLDLFLPLKTVMELVQSSQIAVWKSVKYIDKLIAHYDRVQYAATVAECAYCPLLMKHIDDVNSNVFKGR